MRQLFVWNERSGEARGPFELSTVEELYEAGVLEPKTLVAAQGDDFWSRLSEHTYTSDWFETPASLQGAESIFARAQILQDAGLQGDVRNAAYDPDYELEILELNPGKNRRLRDFFVLAGGLNIVVALGLFIIPLNPISATVLLTSFVGGNISLSWLFGFVLRY